MLKDNPFYILDATTRDNRQKIVELAEEKSFDIDEDLCQKARSDLTMPRNRVLAELNWLPGVSPRKVALFISQLKTSGKDLYSIEGIPDLARINILMELLNTEHIKFNNNELEEIIINIVYDFEKLNIDKIIRDINEDRIVSGFPEINDYELVENHLIEKKRSCVKLILKCLNNLDTKHLIDIVTRIVDKETNNGEKQAPSMIEDLVDDYKLHTQNFLEQEFEKIKKLIEVIQDRADEGEDNISPLIDKLLDITRNWDSVAQPIQLSMKSRGLNESLSNQVAYNIRDLLINLHNDYSMVRITKKLADVLLELFKELPEFENRIHDDISTLQNNEKAQKNIVKDILTELKVEGIEYLSSEELTKELKNGAKIKRFKYCQSFLLVTYNKTSPLKFIKSNESYFQYMLPYLLISLTIGWWGIPWGPIYTIGDIFENIFGGEDVTPKIKQILKMDKS